MAKIDLKFLDVYDKDSKCYINVNTLEIDSIKNPETESQQVIKIEVFDDGDYGNVYLDKSTAIKFAKTLRTEINKIKD
jgi:hypothetical protein